MTLAVQHVHAGNLYGGVETILVTLARFQSAAPDVEHRFALCFEGRLADELRAAGARVDILGPTRISRPWTVARARRQLRGLLSAAEIGVGVCHSTWSQAIFGPVLRTAGVPWTLCVHGGGGPRWLTYWGRHQLPDFVLSNSRYTAAEAATRFAGVPPVVLYYPVPVLAGLTAEDRQALRREFAVAPDEQIILQVSRMEAWKGHSVLLDALAELRDRADWACWFAGGAQRASESRYETTLKRKAAALGLESRVRFLGQRADAPRLMGAADVFCQPNVSPEPFGIVFIEALAQGLPVVGSNTGGTREIVAADCGVLVPPGDAHALAAALAQLLDDPVRRTRLAAHGPARARALCDPATQVRSLAEHLRGLGARRRSGR